jgi:carbonic anhydrase
MRKSRITRVVCFAFILIISSGAQEQHAKHNWDYGEAQGPSHWGDLSPEFAQCKMGHHQSPVDIRNPRKEVLPPISFHYQPSPLHIIDNGHTIQVNYAPGSFILVGEKKYALRQFHFHRPSEEKINGRSFDMTVHLVHMDENGKLAVVAVLLQEGSDNPLVRELWTDLPREKEKEELFEKVQIDISQILPSDRSYYTFSGSLTTPPCSEDVTWFVLKVSVTISAAEINQFSQLYRNDARPSQPLNDRVVLESQ